MSTVTRPSIHSAPDPYVHKLRLDTQDGGLVEIKPATLVVPSSARVIAKVIGASLAAALLLALIGGVAINAM